MSNITTIFNLAIVPSYIHWISLAMTKYINFVTYKTCTSAFISILMIMIIVKINNKFIEICEKFFGKIKYDNDYYDACSMIF